MTTTTTRRNPHCPVCGCETANPHADDPVVKELILEFSRPEHLTQWALTVMTEFRESLCDDLKSKRVFAWHLGLRQPKELFVRTLYAVLLAEEKELDHIFAGAPPNSLTFYYKHVNRAICENRGLLLRDAVGYEGRIFKPVDVLNDSAHVSLRSVMTCVGAIRNPHRVPTPEASRASFDERYCDVLDYMARSFKAGKTRSEVLAGVIKLYRSSPLLVP